MGMVFRCDLDGSEVETLAWNFRNNYEVAVDSFGTMWQSDNDDDGNSGGADQLCNGLRKLGYHDEITGRYVEGRLGKGQIEGRARRRQGIFTSGTNSTGRGAESIAYRRWFTHWNRGL